MPDSTPILGLPFPTLTDDPNGPAQIESLAMAAEAVFLGAADNLVITDYSAILSGANVALTQAVTTNILTVTFTLSAGRTLMVGGSASCVGSGGQSGAVGLALQIDGTLDPMGFAGYIDLGASQTLSISILTHPVQFDAGAHSIHLQADRDANNVIQAKADSSFNSRGYHPTKLLVYG
jgi:hypothetical protein